MVQKSVLTDGVTNPMSAWTSQTTATGQKTGGIFSGQYLCSPVKYAPSTQTTFTASSATMAAVSSGVICTGAFKAPPSGCVIVGISFVAQYSAGAGFAIGLALTGTTTMIGNPVVPRFSGTGINNTFNMPIAVMGLTSGSSYNFDLMYCMTTSDTFTITAYAQSPGTTPSLGSTGQGAPVVMTVQGI